MNGIFWGKALEKKGIAIKICVKAYRYGFNGKEKDDQGEWGSTNYDYGFRIYSPAIARFLSVDPLARNFPWNSAYAYAENDVIRSIDLDGLEKVGVTESPMNAGRIRELFKVKNYRKIHEIIEYSSTHGWIDSEGRPSDYIERKYVEQHGSKGPGISKGSSGMIFNDLYVDEGLVEQYGDINDHGGYMKIQFFNWETNEYEYLGTLPLSKVNEHEQLTTYGDDESFWSVEPEYNVYDVARELRSRAISLIPDALKKGKGPFFIDIESAQYEKLKYAVKGRLRALGSNSAFEVDLIDKKTYQPWKWRIEYQIDEKGNETFSESVIDGNGG